MAETRTDLLLAKAAELAAAGAPDAAAQLVALAAGDRPAVEAARDIVARRLHGHAADWDATATLTVLNRALVGMGWTDPYDWRPRWRMPRLVRAFRRP